MFGLHEHVLDVEARAAEEGGEIEEIQRQANADAIYFGKHRVRARHRPEQGGMKVRGGGNSLVLKPLECRKRLHKPRNVGRILLLRVPKNKGVTGGLGGTARSPQPSFLRIHYNIKLSDLPRSI